MVAAAVQWAVRIMRKIDNVFLGRGLAFRDCGIHLVGSHFPTDGSGLRDSSESRFCGDFAARG
jgi:hypothetical protein